MGVLFVIFAVLLLFISYQYEKSIYSPTVMLSFFWALIGLGSVLSLYGMYTADDKTYFVCLISLLAFSLGTFSTKHIRIVMSKPPADIRISNTYSFNKVIYVVCVVLMLAFCSFRFFNVIKMRQMGYSYNAIRMVYFGNEVGGFSSSYIESAIEIYLNLPLLYAAMTVTTLNLVLPKGQKLFGKTITALSLIWIIMAQFITGGRTTLYVFAVELIFAFFIVKNADISIFFNMNRNVYKMLFIVVAVLGLMVILSINRTGSPTYNFMKSIYTDFCGCFTHMSLRWKNITDNDYTYGISLLSGLLRPIVLPIKWVIGSYPQIYSKTIEIGELLSPPIYIGPNIEYNAYVLAPYYFYYDCGILGVFFDSLVCGVFCEFVYNKASEESAQNAKNRLFAALYLLIVYSIFTSMIRYSGNLVYIVYAFFAVRLFFRRECTSAH